MQRTTDVRDLGLNESSAKLPGLKQTEQDRNKSVVTAPQAPVLLLHVNLS